MKIFRWDEDYLTSNEKIEQKQKNESGFLYVAMMSAEHYLDKRAKAAVETWAQDTIQLKNKSFVNVEIFASGQGTCFFLTIKIITGLILNQVYFDIGLF